MGWNGENDEDRALPISSFRSIVIHEEWKASKHGMIQ